MGHRYLEKVVICVAFNVKLLNNSLGMEHDGPQDGNACDQDIFVMSPTLGAGKTAWSSCSRDYLDKFLRTPQAACILAPSAVKTLSERLGDCITLHPVAAREHSAPVCVTKQASWATVRRESAVRPSIRC